jgi:hypothetical protein
MERRWWLRLWVQGPERDQEMLRGQVGRGCEAEGQVEQIRRIRVMGALGCGCGGGHAGEATRPLRQNTRSCAEPPQKKKVSQGRDIFPPGWGRDRWESMCQPEMNTQNGR